MMNYIFLAMVVAAFLAAAWRQMLWNPPTAEQLAAMKAAAEAAGAAFVDPTSPMQDLTAGALDAAAKAVDISIGLIGGMALFLGVMKVAEKGGMMQLISRAIRPLMVLLFPDVPPTHPAMGAMILNLSANALGLGNAATPFGIKAMQELDKLNPTKGTATNAMALFLAINTSSVTLLPTGVMVVRASLGSHDPGGIFGTTLVATTCSTLSAILAVKLFQRFASPMPPPVVEAPPTPKEASPTGDEEQTLADGVPAMPASETPWLDEPFRFDLRTTLHLAAVFGGLGLFIGAALLWGQRIGPWVIPCLIFGMLVFGFARGVDVYATLVEGAREGWNTAKLIVPYLVAILVAVGMLRASKALDALLWLLSWPAGVIGMPPEALPMALLRPLSGSGAYAVMMDTMKTYGPDSYTGYLVSTIQGSTETTFYVLAVYFGAVQVTRSRHTIPAALVGELCGVLGSVFAVRWYLGML